MHVTEHYSIKSMSSQLEHNTNLVYSSKERREGGGGGGGGGRERERERLTNNDHYNIILSYCVYSPLLLRSVLNHGQVI